MNRLCAFALTMVLASWSIADAMQVHEQPLCFMFDGEGKSEEAKGRAFYHVALANPDLRVLMLKNISLTRLPEGIGRFAHLHSLDVEGNALTEASAAVIGQLTNLRYLNISRNWFKVLPAAIMQLRHLRILRAAENYISTMHGRLRNLKQLRSLDLMCNDLPKLDPSIGELDQLEELFLDFNLLKRLPDSMRQLSNLTRLSLTHNYFKAAPGVVRHLCDGHVAVDLRDECEEIKCEANGDVVVCYDQETQHKAKRASGQSLVDER